MTAEKGISDMKKKFYLVRILLLLLLLSLSAGAFFLYHRLLFVQYTQEEYVESAADLQNPYIGWYQIYGYTITEDAAFDFSEITELEHGPGLVLLQLNLKNYAHIPLSKEALNCLDDILSAWQSTGRQLILRFLYDWDGNAAETEPDSLSLIIKHMSQTAEVVNRHSDCVYILQGIFVGAWGEMHGSRYLDEESMRILAKHLNFVMDEQIFLAVRTPEQWRTITRSSDPIMDAQTHEELSGSPAIAWRLGLFNDGMLGSETDLGTYASSDGAVSGSSYEKRSRQEELAFQNQLCRFVPNGGEVVIDNSFNDFRQAADDLKTMHVSYLNSLYDPAVLSKWAETVYTEASQSPASGRSDLKNSQETLSPWEGMNGLDYISRHLGYRYCIRSSWCEERSPLAENVYFSLEIENTGFSSSYRSFDITLSMVHCSTGKTYTVPTCADTRLWNAGESVTLSIPLDIRSMLTGSYEIYFAIYDPASDCPILPANELPYAKEGSLLGRLKIGGLTQ